MSTYWRLGAALAVLGLTAAADATVFAGASVAAGSAPVAVISANPSSSARPGVSIKAPAAPAHAFINRPTMPLSQYQAIKSGGHSLATRPGVTATATRYTVSTGFGFNAIAQSGTAGWYPSDSNGAVAGNQVAEVVNSNFVTYDNLGNQTSNRTLNTLANYATESLFDPRIIYDSTWKRWIVVADAFAESSTVQDMFIMVSKGGSAAGNYWVYRVNSLGFCGGTGPFWDYPQVGETQDAVVVTGNCFNSAGEAAETWGVAKSTLYNGLGFGVPVFGVGSGVTATPANVSDQRPTDILLTTNQHMVSFQDPQSGGYASITANRAITGFEAYATPRNAGQAGCTTTSCTLDTSDGRFVQDSTQFGDQLWNVATYGFGGTSGLFATPYWGQFSIAGASTTQFGAAFADGCSDDWNASLAVTTAGKMFLNWNSTDPQGSSCGQTFVRQMNGGRVASTAPGTLSNMINPFTSGAELTGDFDSSRGFQRWGDTSSVWLANNSTAWSVNNSVQDGNNWGTRWQKLSQ